MFTDPKVPTTKFYLKAIRKNVSGSFKMGTNTLSVYKCYTVGPKIHKQEIQQFNAGCNWSVFCTTFSY